MTVSLRLHLVTLGVEDIERAARFYETLGMKRRVRNANGVAFFDAGGTIVSLYGRDDLARDAGLDSTAAGSGSLTLAFNVDSESAVDEALDAAAKAGGKILKPGYRVFWGGYIGYFADPDGHVWEVAHNPQFPFDEHGRLALPE
ncbi:MAG: VOC family protein [Bradyrhizobiaceae bacterium]|nr:VOC family protein [Bradyrhizobiaceae bacterium]